LLRGRETETATERKRRRTGGSSGACGIKENEKGEKERAEEAGGEHSDGAEQAGRSRRDGWGPSTAGKHVVIYSTPVDRIVDCAVEYCW
jgi:hypothetical protein